MKYKKVNARSVRATSPAISHHHRTGLDARHATNRLASVSSVSGTVVTNPQNLRPVSSRRAASAFQWEPEDSEEVIHRETTIRCSYKPAPNAMPRLMTNSHNRVVDMVPSICSLPIREASIPRARRGRLSSSCGVLLNLAIKANQRLGMTVGI